jgi:outer membrane protein OmpA-like peptidoglycan-associated protein
VNPAAAALAGLAAVGLAAFNPSAYALDTQAPIADATAEDLVMLLGGALPNRAFTRTALPEARTHLCQPSVPAAAPGCLSGRSSGSRTLEVLEASPGGAGTPPPQAEAPAAAEVPYAGDATPGVHLDVRFAFGSDRLSAADIVLLDNLAAALRDDRLLPERFAVAGHTDAVGPAALNLELSCARALAVTQHLRARGVEAARLSAYGFGSTRLLGGAPPTAALHRRVEIRRAP